MIVLYTWKTPNGRKPAIMLEEVGLPYRVEPVDLSVNAQFAPDFLAISPNNKIPAIVDEDAPGGPQSIFESGAILIYLAEKSGRLLAAGGPGRWSALEWLQWQVGSLGPMLGQLNFFAVRSPDKAPLAIDRFTEEGKRLLTVMETRLATTPYLAGADYSIADVATYPWMVAAKAGLSSVLGERLARSPAIDDWLTRVGGRPAVQAGMKVLEV